ncbi:discoidin domain-containing receptor 2 [Caerostris extrusa]|uniref:Discoidin domain-containing receptor 2 n=1 Tax=Caerostris extrusa TaxID=172846 RepID=A0AAV4W308_CAEEX|nr:discoidin domain-containing receptor 2 [Caerostris extrusa]
MRSMEHQDTIAVSMLMLVVRNHSFCPVFSSARDLVQRGRAPLPRPGGALLLHAGPVLRARAQRHRPPAPRRRQSAEGGAALRRPWMLLSEVSFDSVPAIGNFTEEDPPAMPPIVSTALNEDALDNQYVGLVIGVLAAVILVLVVAIFVIVARNKRRKDTSPHNILSPRENRVAVNLKVSETDRIDFRESDQ